MRTEEMTLTDRNNHLSAPGTPNRARPIFNERLRRLGLVFAALASSTGLMVASATVASAKQPKKPPAKHKTPCLVGKWTVTNFALTDGGVTASGGAGIQVDISANTVVIGHFNPGAPLKSGTETIKFSGTAIGKYGFSPKTTAKTGTFPVTYTSASNLMVSVNGGPATPVSHASTTGAYVCTGKDLTLSYPPGGNEIVYKLVPTK